MGTVYEALQEDLGRRVALKVLLPEYAMDAQVVGRFRREAQTAASLGHANIVQVTDFGVDPERGAFLVMELLQGESLASALRRETPMDPGRVTAIAVQILDALIAAHGTGVVHRDLKPDNVYLVPFAGSRDGVKLLDFGIARLTQADGATRLTATGAVLGTPVYMSPEQARGRDVDARSDLYSLGVLMYEALSGRLPFSGDSYNALLFAIAEETPAPLSHIRPDITGSLANVVERAMQKDRNARFSSAIEMRAALGPAAQQHGPRSDAAAFVHAATMLSQPRSPQTARRIAPWIALPVLAVIVLIAIEWRSVSRTSRPAMDVRVTDAAPSMPVVPNVVATDLAAPAVPDVSAPVPAVPAAAARVPAAPAPAAPVRRVALPMAATAAPTGGGSNIAVADFMPRFVPPAELERILNSASGVRGCGRLYVRSSMYAVWRLAIDGSGHVTRAARTTDDPANPAWSACLSRALRNARFAVDPAPPGSLIVSLSGDRTASIAR